MEIRKIKCKSGNEYNIVNEYWETSNSWGHKSTLIAPFGEVETNKVRYYNRTWESYTYQSCMNELLSKILEDSQKSYVARYKDENGISRLTSKQKDIALGQWKELEYVKDLKEIKERIRTKNFD